ncbi:uncharacterized protein LOC132379895 [Hypanus sabinus]|uniref:uncharacterized protein LOC132379895 n=1 Tax=Hypanus sabinus TaxID=79690 RepID=UPI0028C38152|nr:uncharacterized protein LOC132379895 [Hypanus sabinus]
MVLPNGRDDMVSVRDLAPAGAADHYPEHSTVTMNPVPEETPRTPSPTQTPHDTPIPGVSYAYIPGTSHTREGSLTPSGLTPPVRPEPAQPPSLVQSPPAPVQSPPPASVQSPPPAPVQSPPPASVQSPPPAPVQSPPPAPVQSPPPASVQSPPPAPVQSPPPAPVQSPPPAPVQSQPVLCRSQRQIRPPDRLNL